MSINVHLQINKIVFIFTPIMKKKSENPSPLSIRICACGCGYEFQPNRIDQDFLNSKHYNHYYNNGPRKTKYAEEKDVTKVIRKNDRILEKYFKLFNQIHVKVSLVVLRAEGFDEAVFTRIVGFKTNEMELKFFALFKYCYRILKQADVNVIEIQKL
jgi:hypothetical protein